MALLKTLAYFLSTVIPRINVLIAHQIVINAFYKMKLFNAQLAQNGFSLIIILKPASLNAELDRDQAFHRDYA